jgi:hypothetical protein
MICDLSFGLHLSNGFPVSDCRLQIEEHAVLKARYYVLNLQSAFLNLKSSWGSPKRGSLGPDSLLKMITFFFTWGNEELE